MSSCRQLGIFVWFHFIILYLIEGIILFYTHASCRIHIVGILFFLDFNLYTDACLPRLPHFCYIYLM